MHVEPAIVLSARFHGRALYHVPSAKRACEGELSRHSETSVGCMVFRQRRAVPMDSPHCLLVVSNIGVLRSQHGGMYKPSGDAMNGG
jgi:hypothetical protein